MAKVDDHKAQTSLSFSDFFKILMIFQSVWTDCIFEELLLLIQVLIFGFSQRVKKIPSDDLRMKVTWYLKFHTRLTQGLSDKMLLSNFIPKSIEFLNLDFIYNSVEQSVLYKRSSLAALLMKHMVLIIHLESHSSLRLWWYLLR